MIIAETIPVGLVIASGGLSEVLLWGSIGVAQVLFLGFALLWFRRRFHPAGMETDASATSFSIESIEEMLARGAITEEEFRCLRAGALGLEPRGSDNENSTLSRPVDVDDGTEESVSHDDSNDDSGKDPQDRKENI